MAEKPLRELLTFDVTEDPKTVKATKRRLTIMSTLATGWLPWGVEWGAALPRYENHFPLCCGHSMKRAEAQLFASAGLLEPGVDRHGGEALVITEQGKAWLGQNWIS